MDSKLRIEHLADHPEVLPMLKEWFETAWESYYGPVGPGDAQRDLLAYANRGELPIGVVALYEDELCGVAALTSASMTTHAHLGPWVAAGLVSPSYRRRGIGTAMVRTLEEVAKNIGYARIYCGTSTAGHLLERRGWQLMAHVIDNGEDVSIYQKALEQRAAAEKEDRMSLAMTRQERETFLADVHVGIISILDEGRGPLAVPIWYTYEPGGELRVVTARASRKGRLLARVGRFSLCAQTETPPYQYVSVEGPIMATEAADVERDLRPLAHRYLGIEMGDRYIEQTRDAHEQAENMLISMRPERWLTVDFAKVFGAL